MATTQPIGSGRPLFNRPFFELATVRLVSYRHVWISPDDYRYECTWSDGEVTPEHTLPWDKLDGVTEVRA